MAQLRFNVKPISGKKMQIRAVFQEGNKQKFKNIGYAIPDAKIKGVYKHWDGEKQIVKNLENAATINALIGKWKAEFASYRDECKRLNKKPNIEQYINSISGTSKIIEEVPSLVSVMQLFLDSIKATHDNNTLKSYRVIKGKIEKYEAHTGKVILVSMVDKAFYKDFSTYLMQEEKNTNATISRRQGKITTVLTHAIEYLKVTTVNQEYKKVYKLKAPPASKFPLLPEELATLRGYQTENGYHRIILDAFLLACETGLRHSDIMQLKPEHIKSQVTAGGMIRYIALTNIKTDNANDMALSNYATGIIDRYVPLIGGAGVAQERVFDFKSTRKKLKGTGVSQAAGKVLKVIFKAAGLNRPCEVVKMQGAKTIRESKPLCEVISFHMARNTYITRLLSSNLAPAYVKDNAGHSDLKITMGYFRDDNIKRWQETLRILNN